MENSVKKPEDAAKTVEKKRTVGNVIYDFGVFGSVAWAGVATLSALSAHESMHGSNPAFGWLRTLNDKSYSGLRSLLSSTILKGASEEMIHGYAKGTTMFLTLGMGGNALAGIIKWLEDNRQRNAALIDNTLGTTPPDPETIAHEPKQTWKSVISGRLMSWGGSYLAFLAMGPKLTGHLGDFFGKHATDLVMKIRPGSNPANVRRWADIAAFDALFTMITAGATYGISRFIAHKDEEKRALSHDHIVYDANPVAPIINQKQTEEQAQASHPHVHNKDGSCPDPEHHPSNFTEKVTLHKKPESRSEHGFAHRVAHGEPAQGLAV